MCSFIKYSSQEIIESNFKIDVPKLEINWIRLYISTRLVKQNNCVNFLCFIFMHLFRVHF